MIKAVARHSKPVVSVLITLGILLMFYRKSNNLLEQNKHYKMKPRQRPTFLTDLTGDEKWTARCEVRYLGCFCKEKPHSFFKQELIYSMRNNKVQDCYEICSKKKLRLAAWSTSHCRCGDLLVHQIPLSPSNKCERKILVYPQVRCPRDDVSVDIYLITKFCEKGVLTKKDLSNHFLGMFKLPPDFFKTAILAPAASQSQVTPVWCYLYCERKEQTLSMVTAANECHCGNTTDQFPIHYAWELKANATDSHMVAVWRTSAQDFRCDLRILLPPLTSKQIFLISFPGAGNTWMRYLIESATGVFTGSIYYDNILAAKGFLGELDDISSGRTLVIKSHRAMTNSSKSIVLIRNPFHTIVAEFTRKSYNESHTWLGSAAIFHSPKWNRNVGKMASKWLQKNLSYLASSSRLLVVYYEDLKQDHVKQMRRVVDFIGFKVNNLEERLLCLQLENTGLFKRPPRKDDFNPYSRDQTELINEYTARLKNYIKENVTSAPPLPNYEREL